MSGLTVELAAGALGGWPPFLVHAVVAGVAIAAASGLVGYLLVLRAQVFTGDALSHVAVTGAFAALAVGVDLRLGLFVATVAVAVGLGLLGGAAGGRGRGDDVVIGAVFAWMLGLGAFFLTLYTTSGSPAATANGNAGVTVLFGSIFGLSSSQTLTAAAVAVAVIVVTLAGARPVLFASLDPVVAAARGLPVRALGVGFLALVGATAAEASQAVGSLLLLGLLAAPAATAQHLSTRPYPAMALSVGLAVVETAAGLGSSVLIPRLPPSFAILAVATAVYAAAHAGTHVATRRSRRVSAGLDTRGSRGAEPAPATTPGSGP